MITSLIFISFDWSNQCCPWNLKKIFEKIVRILFFKKFTSRVLIGLLSSASFKIYRSYTYIIYIIYKTFVNMFPLAGQTVGPNGLKFFCAHSWVAWGWHRQKNPNLFFNIFFWIFYLFFFHGQLYIYNRSELYRFSI